MGLETRYRESFSKSLKEAGSILFSNGSVTYIQGSESSVTAEVTDGAELYEVHLNCPDKQLKIKCDCHSTQNKPCEHIWAVLLSAEKLKLLKNGSKRGARLAGTAAAQKAKKKPNSSVVNQSFSPIPITSSEAYVDKELLYVVNQSKSNWLHSLCLELFWRPKNKKGPVKPYSADYQNEGLSSDDKNILFELKSISDQFSSEIILKESEYLYKPIHSAFTKGTLFTRENSSDYKFAKVKENLESEIEWDFSLSTEGYEISAQCYGESLKNFFYVSSNFIFLKRAIVKISQSKVKLLFNYILNKGFLVPPWEVELFLEKVLVPSGITLVNLPGRLKCEREKGTPRGHLYIRTALFKYRDKEQLHADLSFNYTGKNILESESGEEVLDFYNSKVLQRDLSKEQEYRDRLKELGFRFNEEPHKEEFGWKLTPSRLPEIVDVLLKENWLIIAEGKSYKAPQSFQLKLSSGEDWFELNGEALFEDEKVLIPQLVQSAKKGERYVELGDGSFGVLPEEWLKHYTVLTQLGEIVGDALRFRKSQGLIIEFLLQELLDSDTEIKSFRDNLEKNSRIKFENTPADFKGELRPYQKQGLSWLKYLRKLGVGGILADDMGLGKTIQILALISSIKKEMSAPILLVVPRSLIFNWIEEVRKFTPHISIVDYTGASRKQLFKQIYKYDIVITTYGTVRQDIEKLIKEDFEYCILDEAQAIKNRDSSTHKALRLINAKYRISMSGTPVENSLSDLVSQFEFLNPGMTGQGKLASLITGDEKLNKETLSKLRESFKPFILRRTKSEVAKDLPPKIEQVVYCKMSESQHQLYNKSLKFYQQEMDKKEKEGKANIEYLGALTRLRQMSCHPALISEDWADYESTKIDVLISKLKEIISEGHRALVFSQFTSFLDLIRAQVEDNNWQYCYLDGATKDRQEQVEKFQTSEIPLFLISLKAGGVGLNLTAADYVFIMDPWWNPAIENQAIDRAYRIGQKKKVIACKLITQGTVEEKVLKMQKVKKYLAGSLVDENSEMVQNLTVDDFRLLLKD